MVTSSGLSLSATVTDAGGTGPTWVRPADLEARTALSEQATVLVEELILVSEKADFAPLDAALGQHWPKTRV